MTKHAARGREFPVVFVAGAEQGLVPLQLEGFDTDEQEERRTSAIVVQSWDGGAGRSYGQSWAAST